MLDLVIFILPLLKAYFDEICKVNVFVAPGSLEVFGAGDDVLVAAIGEGDGLVALGTAEFFE